MWGKWAASGISGASVPLYASRFELLTAAARAAPTDGLWLEFGVYRGDSIQHLARLTGGEVVGFDSFEGLPARWVRGYDRGAFSTGGAMPKVAPNVTLVKGLFRDTLPRFLRDQPPTRVALAHVDCDLYESTRDVLVGLHTELRPGTVLVFDEFAGIPPDDEARALRETVHATRLGIQYLGCSANGAVAVRLVERDTVSGPDAVR
jgi:hypothetical protein